MKKYYTIIFILFSLILVPVCHASIQAQENDVATNMDKMAKHIVLANNTGIRAGLSSQYIENGATSMSENEKATVSTTGLAFAFFLMIIGSMFRRKKKNRTSGTVGVFTRTN